MTLKTLDKPTTPELAQRAPFPMLSDPWGEFERMRKLMDEMMSEFFSPTHAMMPRMMHETVGTWRPALNMYRQNGNLIVEAAMPGLKKEDIQVGLTGQTLTLHGHRKDEKKIEKEHLFCSEMREGQFSSSIKLPVEVTADKVKAEYKDGILRLTMPLVEPEKHKTVNVKIG